MTKELLEFPKKQEFPKIDLKPVNLTREMIEATRPKYVADVDLRMSAMKVAEQKGQSDFFWQALASSRNPELDGKVFKFRGPVKTEKSEEHPDGYKMGEREVRPTEIADANFKEMERATAQKWHNALAKIFNSPYHNSIPVRSPDGQLKIACPGSHLCFEAGGILDYFNNQGVSIDIDAVDINEAGAEKQFMRLEERVEKVGSMINFQSDLDASLYFEGKKEDIVILRHPGPIFEMYEYLIWKRVIETMLKTEPSVVILSTFDHKIEDEEVKKDLGFPPEKEVYEFDIFRKLIEQGGFHMGDFSSTTDDTRLVYPLSPYNIAFQTKTNLGGDQKLSWDNPYDTFIVPFVSEKFYETAELDKRNNSL